VSFVRCWNDFLKLYSLAHWLVTLIICPSICKHVIWYYCSVVSRRIECVWLENHRNSIVTALLMFDIGYWHHIDDPSSNEAMNDRWTLKEVIRKANCLYFCYRISITTQSDSWLVSNEQANCEQILTSKPSIVLSSNYENAMIQYIVKFTRVFKTIEQARCMIHSIRVDGSAQRQFWIISVLFVFKIEMMLIIMRIVKLNDTRIEISKTSMLITSTKDMNGWRTIAANDNLSIACITNVKIQAIAACSVDHNFQWSHSSNIP
jgi:hypothetical protein